MVKLRLKITKGEEIRFISHLDYARTLERAIRRANMPVQYTEGFNPHMKISFASALAVGLTSTAEYIDIELRDDVDCDSAVQQLRAQLPPGIEVLEKRKLLEKTPALMAVVNQASYVVKMSADKIGQEKIEKSIQKFNSADIVSYTKTSPKGKRTIDIKKFLTEDLRADYLGKTIKIFLQIAITTTGSVKPGEVFSCLMGQSDAKQSIQNVSIERTGIYIIKNSRVLSPFEL